MYITCVYYITDMADNFNFQHDLDIKVETYNLDQYEEILDLVSETTNTSGNVTYTEDGMLFQFEKDLNIYH